MDQTNKDLFENVKQYECEQDNSNNDSPKSIKSNCSSNGSANGEGTHKNKTSEAQLRAIKRYQEKNKEKNKENTKKYYEDNKEYLKQCYCLKRKNMLHCQFKILEPKMNFSKKKLKV